MEAPTADPVTETAAPWEETPRAAAPLAVRPAAPLAVPPDELAEFMSRAGVSVRFMRGLVGSVMNDDVTDTIDYSLVAARVIDHITGDPVNLIETLAQAIALDLLSNFAVASVEVTVHKPQAPLEVAFTDVSVTVRRERS